MRFTSEGFKVISSTIGIANPPICGPNQTPDTWGNCMCNSGYARDYGAPDLTGNPTCTKSPCKGPGAYTTKGKCGCPTGSTLDKTNTCIINKDPNNCFSKIAMVPDSRGNCICSNPPCAV